MYSFSLMTLCSHRFVVVLDQFQEKLYLGCPQNSMEESSVDFVYMEYYQGTDLGFLSLNL